MRKYRTFRGTQHHENTPIFWVQCTTRSVYIRRCTIWTPKVVRIDLMTFNTKRLIGQSSHYNQLYSNESTKQPDFFYPAWTHELDGNMKGLNNLTFMCYMLWDWFPDFHPIKVSSPLSMTIGKSLEHWRWTTGITSEAYLFSFAQICNFLQPRRILAYTKETPRIHCE